MMKKMTILLLACLLALPLAAGMPGMVKAEEKDSVTFVYPALMTDGLNTEEMDRGLKKFGVTRWELGEDGSLMMEMPSQAAAGIRDLVFSRVEQRLLSAKATAVEDGEWVEASSDYSHIQAFVNPDQFTDENCLSIYCLAAAASQCQVVSQIPASEIDVKLEFISHNTGDVLKTLNLAEIISKLHELKIC